MTSSIAPALPPATGVAVYAALIMKVPSVAVLKVTHVTDAMANGSWEVPNYLKYNIHFMIRIFQIVNHQCNKSAMFVCVGQHYITTNELE